MDRFCDRSVKSFADSLASSAPTPGGGAAAALAAAFAASLVSMTAELTVGKEKYRSCWNKMARSAEECLRLRLRCEELADEDAEAYGAFVSAMRMPKDLDDEKAARAQAIKQAARRAAEVPLETMEMCAEIGMFALEATVRGNKNAISDSASGAIFARAAARAAAMNVEANLPLIGDDEFASASREKMRTILSALERCEAEADRALTNSRG